MISTSFLRRQEQSYLDQLEQIIVQRLRVTEDVPQDKLHSSEPTIKLLELDGQSLSPLSREINEELDRLEKLVLQADE